MQAFVLWQGDLLCLGRCRQTGPHRLGVSFRHILFNPLFAHAPYQAFSQRPSCRQSPQVLQLQAQNISQRFGQIPVAGTVIKHAQESRIGIRCMQNLIGLAG